MKDLSCGNWNQATVKAHYLANQATQALIDEVRLTPKPGLVDGRGSGVHRDLTLALMEKSARSLWETFYVLALKGYSYPVDRILRQEIGKIGRQGEACMMQTTQGVNTHRGAIWALGLLVTVLAGSNQMVTPKVVLDKAGKLAQFPDPVSPKKFSKGLYVCHRYKVPGAREEAQQGFPHILNKALPILRKSRQQGATESQARGNALLAIMSSLTDTCLLFRGGEEGLTMVQGGATTILQNGGLATIRGQALYTILEAKMMAHNLSPGGAADLLAATLFLDKTIG